jgi:hypothetical protein
MNEIRIVRHVTLDYGARFMSMTVQYGEVQP